jgi:oligopeptidase A
MSVMNDSKNPLLQVKALPSFESIKVEHVEPAVDAMLASNRQRIEELIQAGEDYNWENFVQPMEEMGEVLGRMWSPVSHLHEVCDSEELRVAYNNCLPKFTNYHTELAQDERLYKAYKAVATAPDFEDLAQAQKKIIDNELRDFRLSGADLNKPDQQRYKAIQEELSGLYSKFEENLLDATQAWDICLTEDSEIAGLPQTALAIAQQAAEQDSKSGWKFTLHAPSYIAFITYADNRALRQQMYSAYVTRASDQGEQTQWDNSEVMLQMLRLRREKAQLLGYPNYAAYSLETKMADTIEQVMSFLNDLAERSRAAAQKDLDELKNFALETDKISHLEAWDVAYYSEKLQQHRYRFSQEEVRPYFPAPQVLSGMFEVVQRLYGLRIKQRQGVEVWHPDVAFYEIRDSKNQLRGQFYIDLYARDHKRGGAWMDECTVRIRRGDTVQTPVAYLTCNFSPPVGDQPSLLTHEEVLTVFHEFGHGLHHMLTQVDYAGVSGINGVAWDAVELPSQFMENWCWEGEALELIARHVDSGEALPKALFEKMLAAKNFQSAMQMVRQLEFSIFDMRLHSEFDPDGRLSIQDVLDDVRREVAVMIPPEFNRSQHSFGHIFSGGYAAGYYSYKWAEVLSADAFSKFEENGIFDRKTGEEFMHNILEAGGSEEPMVLFKRFRGREPNIDALLRHSGLSQ